MPDTKFPVKDDTLYPPDASMRGDNAHYLDYCEAGGHRPGYAVCLNKIKAVEERRLEGQLGGCEAAINGRTCPAFHMRENERLEGRALYYVNRSKLNEWIAEQNKQPISSAFLDELKAARPKAAPKRTEPAKAAAPAPVVASVEGGYAAAINAAMAETAAEPPKAAEPAPRPAEKPFIETIGEPLKSTGSAPSLKPMPGESLLEFAKRQREARATA
ncbi:hypothetical protein [Paraburkholderia sp.]|uniref:hypothetical protein n=1 Tax=Paraburkholderia sp. TaxID=1926495 RepID=UPI0039E21CBE